LLFQITAAMRALLRQYREAPLGLLQQARNTLRDCLRDGLERKVSVLATAGLIPAHFRSHIIITEPPKKVADSKAAVATTDGKQ
jgi:hypothetical protein